MPLAKKRAMITEIEADLRVDALRTPIRLSRAR
jgi:hypothetical protein